jgi:hypothetical protein
MSIYKVVLGILASVYLAGCAHPMNIKPDVQTLEPAKNRIQKNVGLYIAPADRALEVTTAGGGGDKVSYHPYADMEAGLYKVLGNVFASVSILSSPSDTAAIAQHSLDYVVTPKITPTSSSDGVFTWMATDFTIQVVCKVSDTHGTEITTVSATGIGKASSSEVRSDMSVAGERASNDALQKLEQAFLQSPQLKQ